MNVTKSTIALSLIAASMSVSAFAQDNTKPMTRAQVASDLKAYQQSGLEALSVTEQGADTNSAEYKAALTSYEQLRGKQDKIVTSNLTRQQVKADLSAWTKAGLPVAVVGNQTPDLDSPQYQAALATYQHNPAAIVNVSDALTRQEVRSDLNAWNKAGLPALTNGDHGADTNSAAYKAAMARYEQLRAQNS